jgi:hypothetical protein
MREDDGTAVSIPPLSSPFVPRSSLGRRCVHIRLQPFALFRLFDSLTSPFRHILKPPTIAWDTLNAHELPRTSAFRTTRSDAVCLERWT